MSGYMYRNISMIEKSQPTDKLKIVKGGGDLNELAIYGDPAPEEKIVLGDVNADGEFNISDVVMMQKWILAVPDVKLADWKAGDLCEDNIIDVFDLCLMKKLLIKQ